MYWYLDSLGKDATIFISDPVPEKFAFLQGSHLFTNERPSGPFDVFIILDCSNPGRLGWEQPVSMAPLIANVDHHGDNTRFGDCSVVVPDAAATGELLYQYFRSQDYTLSPAIAQALYTAIMTDTGGFGFSNTNGRVLRACADLCDSGADCSRAFQKVYASHSPNGMKLRARIWSTLAFYFDNRVCTLELPVTLIDELDATYGDSEGMADVTLTAEGVEVGMLIKHRDNETHFSLRSNGRVDVGSIARQTAGGGGHVNAAGCTLNLPMEQARANMLERIRKELD
jgi:phosphoesterase RecJ-like protein